MKDTRITRRRFITGMAALPSLLALQTPALPAPAADQDPSGKGPRPPRIGLALGSGGAKGLAHLPVLEAFDELGLVPHEIAGSSIGAVLGALYASGLKAKEIRAMIEEVLTSREQGLPTALLNREIYSWVEFLEPALGNGGLLGSDRFMGFLQEKIQAERFEQLAIRLLVVTADFCSRKRVVYNSGELLPPVKGSMAIPGIFPPVTFEGRVLVDGGTVDPVPFDILSEECDLTVAVDVVGDPPSEECRVPGFFEEIFRAVHIMHEAINNSKLECRPPDLYLRPPLSGIRILEFHRAEEIYAQSAAMKEDLKRRLDEILD